MTAISSSPTPTIVKGRLQPVPECRACLVHLALQQQKFEAANRRTTDDPKRMFRCLLSAHQDQLSAHYAEALQRLERFFLHQPLKPHLDVYKVLLQFGLTKDEKNLLWLAVMVACTYSDIFQSPIEMSFKLDLRERARELFDLGIACNSRHLFFSPRPQGWRLNLNDVISFDDGLFDLLHTMDQKFPIHELYLSLRPENPWTPDRIERLFGALSGPKSIELHGMNLFPIQNGSLTVPDHWKQSLKELKFVDVNLTGDLLIDFPDLCVFIQDSPDLQSITAPQADSITYFLSHWWARPASQLVAVRAQKATYVRVRGAKRIHEFHAPEAEIISLEGDHLVSTIVALKCHELCIPMCSRLKWKIHPQGKCITLN